MRCGQAGPVAGAGWASSLATGGLGGGGYDVTVARAGPGPQAEGRDQSGAHLESPPPGPNTAYRRLLVYFASCTILGVLLVRCYGTHNVSLPDLASESKT